MKKHKNAQLKPHKTMRLKDDHSWVAPDGYKIAVLDRGAVSFNFPESWHLVKMEPFELNDNLPPDDDARISVSFWRLPPAVDWTGLPLAPMLVQSTHIDKSERKILERGSIVTVERDDIELMWTEYRFIDPVEKREAYTRIAVGRGFDVQVLITSDYWVDDALRLRPIWAEVMRSLQLGRTIQDPTKGITLH